MRYKDSIIEHYGKKGMRWGVRKEFNKSTRKNSKKIRLKELENKEDLTLGELQELESYTVGKRLVATIVGTIGVFILTKAVQEINNAI